MMRENLAQKKTDRVREMLKGTADLISWDWTTLLLFEVTYKYILLLLSVYFQDIFLTAMNYAGIISLTGQNLWSLLTTPASILLLLLLFALLIAAAYIEIAGVLLYFEDGRHGRKTSVFRLFRGAIKRLPGLFRRNNAGLIPFLLLILPLTGFTLSSGLLNQLRLPGFIVEFLLNKPLLALLYAALMITLYYLLFRYLFCLQGIVLFNEGFTEAGRECRSLLKGRETRALSSLFFWLLSAAGAAVAIYLAALGVLILSAKVFYGGEQEFSAFWFTYSRLTDVGTVLLSIYTMVSNLGVLTFLYYQFRDEEESALREKNTVTLQRYRERREWLAGLLRTQAGQCTGQWKNRNRLYDPKKNRRKEQAAAALRTLLILLLVIFYAESSLFPGTGMRDLSAVQIVAHRGGSYFAPENTLAALQEAKRSGAAYAEIDVRQTADGVLIAAHDANLKRIAGIDRSIGETEAAELAHYEAGEWFSPSFSGERIPTLEEMIRAARGEIGLMIELKNSDYSQGQEEKAVALIQKYNAEKRCVIASMSYEALERVKQLNPEIRTVFITPAAYGNFIEKCAADAVSIEESAITPSLVHLLHAEGKSVYVWTVNREAIMRKMIGLQVDGIVTDNPYLAGYVLETGGREALAGRLAKTVLDGWEEAAEAVAEQERLN